MSFAQLKDFFARFLRDHHFGRHFRNMFILDVPPPAAAGREMPKSMAEDLKSASVSGVDEMLHRLDSRRTGLSESRALELLHEFGPNQIENEKAPPWPWHLWLSYRNPFNVLLTLLALISFITGDHEATIIICVMVAFSTLLRFIQEEKAGRQVDALKNLVSNTATVVRSPDPLEERADGEAREEPSQASMQEPAKETPGPNSRAKAAHLAKVMAQAAKSDSEPSSGTLLPSQYELPIKSLVPGDIIMLAAGDMIPADCRVLTAKDLFVSQAAMTGESMPVEKFPEQSNRLAVNPLDLENILFMGTNVISGSAVAIVLKTGKQSYFGSLASKVINTDRSSTSFQVGVNKISWLLIRFMMVMVPFVLFINGFTKGDWVGAALFALSIAVGLTPEMLPMIVTATLAKGAVFLSKKKVIVKRLDAIQSFGAMTVLCTDKTGTLTQDKIALSRHTNAWGDPSDEVLEMAYLNSYYQTGLRNLLDEAVLEHTEVQRELNPAANYRKLDEIPFDFERRRMSVVVSHPDGGALLITKGAVEETLCLCDSVRNGDKDVPITGTVLEEARAAAAELNRDGLRVVAVAIRQTHTVKNAYGVKDESQMTLLGYIAFLDPPKESAAPAIRALAEHGISVKVLTGDNELVSRKVCRDVGICAESGGLLSGADIEGMADAELAAAVAKTAVFCKLTPGHKARIVQAIKDAGHTVGFMGDGINDAPALRIADIGISVDSGVDIAKEAADLILLEKSLMVLEEGVREGRRTFCNMLKYIKITASSNFGNVLSVLVAGAFLPFMPMLPLHLLIQNLLYDISQTAIPFDNVDEELLKKPQSWNPADVGRFMLFFGPISSIFDILTFVMMWTVFGANTPDNQSLFQSGWFIMGLCTQTLIVHMIRTPGIPFVRSKPSGALAVMTVVILAAGISIPLGPLAEHLKMQAPPLLYFAFLPLIIIGYACLTQAMKRYYIRRFGWQ